MTSYLETTGIPDITSADVQTGVLDEFQANISSNAVVSLYKPTGILISSYSSYISNLYNTATDQFTSCDPTSNTGIYLDFSVKNSGLTRIDAIATAVYLLLTATQSATVPADTQITSGDYTIENSDDISIDNTECSQANFEITAAVEDYTYEITINGTSISYTATDTDTTETIAQEMADAVHENLALFTGTASGSTFYVNETTDGTVDYSLSFNAQLISSDNISLTSFSVLGKFLDTETGAIAIPAGTFDGATVGVENVTCTQPDAGFTGNAEETDQELRMRFNVSSGKGSLSTTSSIQSNLLETNYVQKCTVYDNPFDTSEEVATGVILPANNVYAVVLGGYSNDIGTVINNKKPETIPTYGSTAVTITTSISSNPVILYFDYSTQIAIKYYLNIVVNSALWYALPSTAQTQIQEALYNLVQGFTNGQTMYDESMRQVVGTVITDGVESVDSYYYILPDYDTQYTGDLEINGNELITLQLSDVVVNITSI